MTKALRNLGVLALAGALHFAVSAQTPNTPPPKLSETFAANLSRVIAHGGPDTSQRTAGIAQFLKGQRLLLLARRQQTPLENREMRQAGKDALIAALRKDPTLAEAYTMLAEIELTSPSQNVDESLAFTSLAVRASPANFGAHRLQARILTRQSRLNQPNFDIDVAAKAVAAWKEVVRLDPSNAEAWAFLAALYEARGETELQISALKSWTSSPTPIENGFYRAVMGRDSDLTPADASCALASALIRAKRADEAWEILAGVIVEEPDNSKAIALATEILQGEPPSKVDRIRDRLKAALRENPTNPALILLLERSK